jgi:hypothetical protein
VIRGCPAAASFRRAGLTNTKSGFGNYREKRATFAIRSVEVKAESMFLIVPHVENQCVAGNSSLNFSVALPEPRVFALPAVIK